MDNNILELSKIVEFNLKSEAQAIMDYNDLIRVANESGLNEEDLKEFTDIIAEIISDELNHQERLHELYVNLTGIKTNKE